MRFQLLISCNNAAFGDDDEDAAREVSRILETVRSQLVDNCGWADLSEHTVRDLNGNTVGTWAFVEDEA